jgi:hypothetical protein
LLEETVAHARVEESNMKTIAFLVTTFVSGVGSAQETPTTGYAPVNGLKMYYEVQRASRCRASRCRALFLVCQSSIGLRGVELCFWFASRQGGSAVRPLRAFQGFAVSSFVFGLRGVELCFWFASRQGGSAVRPLGAFQALNDPTKAVLRSDHPV